MKGLILTLIIILMSSEIRSCRMYSTFKSCFILSAYISQLSVVFIDFDVLLRKIYRMISNLKKNKKTKKQNKNKQRHNNNSNLCLSKLRAWLVCCKKISRHLVICFYTSCFHRLNIYSVDLPSCNYCIPFREL